jgi:hypothetical protein
LWVYSGRRGIHCWVSDPVARKLGQSGRSAVAEYLQVITGGESKTKKVTLRTTMHPSISKSLDIIKGSFERLCLKDQDILGDAERWNKVLALVPDDDLREQLAENMPKSKNSVERWNMINDYITAYLKKRTGKPKTTQNILAEIMLQFAYPRLDIAVSKGLNHLLKSPFCVHPKTGRVCIPIDPNKAEQFDPMSVPTITQLTSEIDKFAQVTKPKLRKYVEQYGGSAVDLEGIFKEYATKHASALNAKAWLNQYWKDLNKGVGKGGLRNARLKIVDGELKIVDGRTKKTIPHPFELDHSKAKELMYDLGLEGADMSDNLDIVYTEWNRAKNNIGNPAIPDQIREAIGESTTLENFVRRRLDETFMLEGERVPQMFKQAAKIQMLDDAMYLKPDSRLEQVIEQRLKIYDDLSNYLVEAAE